MNEPSASEASVRARLKHAARRLFAERGLRNVTVREIAKAAGQKNLGAVGYYFASKENLAKEILIEGATVIETRRMAILDALEREGDASSAYKLVQAIILPSAELVIDAEKEQYFNRFLLDLDMNNRGLITAALGGRWNTGYQRCLHLLRHTMQNLTSEEQNRRFVLLGSYLGGILALRETILAERSRSHPVWQSDEMLKDIIVTAVALLHAPQAEG